MVIGFSLGCRIGKYFLHFCHAKKGDAWMAKNIGHFVPLGGPWLGAVQLMKAVMIDGSFAPLGSLLPWLPLFMLLSFAADSASSAALAAATRAASFAALLTVLP